MKPHKPDSGSPDIPNDKATGEASVNSRKSVLQKILIAGQLAAREAHRKKLQSVDLRKADQQIGKKAYEGGLVPSEHTGIVSQLDELRTRIEELRQSDKTVSGSFGEKAKAAANTAARNTKIETLKFKENNLLAGLGAKLRTGPNSIPALSAEISTANTLQDRLNSLGVEIEKLRADSWVKRPLLIVCVLLLVVGVIFGIKAVRNAGRSREDARTRDALAAQFALAQKEQKESNAGYEKNRQTQMDSVRDLMASSEKAQRDYQDKQKREQKERNEAERAKTDAENKQQMEVARQADERRRGAEAKQKAQEADFLKHLPQPAIAASNRAPAAAPNITLNSIPLGPWPKTQSEMESRVAIPSDGSRVLVVASQGSRVQAIVDGQPGPVCRNIRWTARDHDDSEPKPSAPAPFSPDNQRVAYITELDGEKEAVVIDSSQSPAYDGVSWLAFGPEGHHVAFQARKKDAAAGGSPHSHGSALAIIDNGKAGPLYDTIGRVKFSADGQHLAYIATVEPYLGIRYGRPDFGRSERCVVLDGQEQGKHYQWADQLVLSRDGKHLAFLIGGDSLGTQKAVIDGRETPAYGFTEQLTMSDDGSRIVFVARDTPKQETVRRLIDSGKVGAEYGYIGDLVISVHGERLAYVAQNKEGNLSEQFVVDNGKASVPYDKVSDLRVSDDGSILSFIAKSSKGSLLVVNGQEFGPFYRIDGKVVFSTDNKHWGCLVEATDSSESRAILRDGQSHPLPKAAQYGSFALEFQRDQHLMATSKIGDESMALEVEAATIDSPVPSQTFYTRDGKHVAKVFTSNQGHSDEKQQVMLDGKPVGPLYLRIRRMQLSDDGKYIAFIGSYNGYNGAATTHVNFDGAEGPVYNEIDDLALAPDGKHFAYAAEERTREGTLWFLVVDGFTGPVFQQILTPQDRPVRRTHFQGDGSLTFLAAAKGQLGRYTYPADALKVMPSMGQTDRVTAGLHVLHKFGNSLQPFLVRGSGQKLFAIGGTGGKYNHGVLFSCNMDGKGSESLYEFYGGDDSGAPKSLIMGQDGNLYGFVDAGLFRYNLQKHEYALTAFGQSPYGMAGVLPDGGLIGQKGAFDHDEWWVIYPEGGGLAPVAMPPPARHIAAVGPDGAIYSTSDDSLFRQASIYSSPKLLHKFADTPEEGKHLAEEITFDPRGVIFGFTRGSGSDRHSIVYRINRDGSDFRVLVRQDQQMDIDGLMAGDDGMLYAFQAGDVNRQAALRSVSTEGGAPRSLSKDWIKPMFYQDHAIFGILGGSIARLQIPQGYLAARQTPQLIIRNVAAPRLDRIQPVAFTSSSGQAVAKSGEAKTNWLVTPPSAPVVKATTKSSTPVPGLTKPAFADSSGALDQELASVFVEKTVGGMSSGDINSLVALYGERVDYLDKGAINADAVRNEFQQYFDRWPQTSWRMTGSVSVQSMEGSRYKVMFPIVFEARNPATGKHASGNARETMVVAQDATNNWKIVYQRENIVHSGKTRRENAGRPVKGERYEPTDSERARENAEEIARRLRSLFPH